MMGDDIPIPSSNTSAEGDGDLLEGIVEIKKLVEDTTTSTKSGGGTGGVWEELSISGLDKISPRLGHSLLSLDNKLLIVGGGNHEGAMADMWEINLSEKENSVQQLPKVEGLRPKYEFLCVPISDNDTDTKKEKDPSWRIWMFGGADTNVTYNDVGHVHNSVWVEAVTTASSTNVPIPRTQGNNSALIEHNRKQYLCVFAGGQAGMDAVQDGNLYLFDVEEQSWIIVPVIGDTPPVTQGHVTVAFGTTIFIHGGLNGSNLHETLYMIDVSGALENPKRSCAWTPVEIGEDPFPAGRAAHAVLGIPSHRRFYIFGGLGKSGPLDDLWEFSLDSKTWRRIDTIRANGSKPSPRFGAAMAVNGIPEKKTSDTEGKSVTLMLFGGMNADGDIFNDLWLMKVNH